MMSNDSAAEVQRLQQELDRLRLRNLQQEQYIHALTSQLHSRQSVPVQGSAPAPAADSSVAAKWQEWRQKRSLSPEPFKRRVGAPGAHSQAIAQPGTKDGRSPDKPHADFAAPPRPLQAAQQQSARTTTSSDLHQQVSAHWPSSKARGFGSERRWYQRGQAADRAAALQQQALAAAAAERQVDDASWLLAIAPRSRSVSNQRSTFGSELRWFETKPGLSPDGNASAQQEHKASSQHTSPTRPRQRSPDRIHQLQGSHGLPEQATLKRKCTFGSAPRWFEYSDSAVYKQTQNASQTTALQPNAAQSQGITTGSQQPVSRKSATPQGQPRDSVQPRYAASGSYSGNSNRSVSAEQSVAQSADGPRSDCKRGLSNGASPSDAVLQQIQEKHAHIQHLAAMISQQQAGSCGHSSNASHKMRPHGYCKAVNSVVEAPTLLPEASHTHNQPSMSQHARQALSPASSMQQMPTPSPTQPFEASSEVVSNSEPCNEAFPGQVEHSGKAHLDAVDEVSVQQPHPRSRLSNEQPAHISRLGLSSLDDHASASSSLRPPLPPSPDAHPSPPSCVNDSLPSPNSRVLKTTPSSTWPRDQFSDPISPAGPQTFDRSQTFDTSQTFDRSRSASPTWRRTASICDRSGLQEDLRNRSAERSSLDQMVAPHPKDWVQNLRDNCRWKRSNSIKETRDLQEEFVHKAESQLETFQQTMQSMSDTASQSELNATQTSLSDQRLPLKQIPQKAPAPTTRHLRHILRTASKAARQGTGNSTVGGQSRQSRSSSSNKRLAAVHRQQQLAAHEAEQRLAAFQAAKEARAAANRKSQGRPTEAARSAVRSQATGSPVVTQQGAPTFVRSGRSAAAKPNTAVRATPAQHAQQQQEAPRRASSGISWAAELQLREPEDEDFGIHSQDHRQPLPGYSATRASPAVAAQAVQPEQRWPAEVATAADTFAEHNNALEVQRQGLNAYYREKAAAEQAAYSEAVAYAQQIQQQQRQAQDSAPSLGLSAELSDPAEMTPGVYGDSVLDRLRGVKAMTSFLTLPSYGSVSLNQPEVETLSPGLPGLQSQLSKMMQEVSQARNEVQGLRSELDHSTLLSQKSGSFSMAGHGAGW